MSDRERLHEIIDSLPHQQIHALLTILESIQTVRDEEFAQRLSNAPEEDSDEETVAQVLSAESEPGEIVSHGESKQHLGL